MAARGHSGGPPDGPIELLFAFSSDAWVDAAAVSIRSAARATDPRRLRVNIAETGLSEQAMATLARSLCDLPLELRFLPVDREMLATFPERGRFKRETWIRILAPELLPDAKRVIYIDSDTLVLGNVEDLWNIDMRGKAVAAASDAYSKAGDGWHRTPFPTAPAVHRFLDRPPDPDDPYFNAGVMVCDLDRWRATNVTARVRTIAGAIGDLWFLDQDALNIALVDDWVPLLHTWNDQQIVEHDRHWRVHPRSAREIYGLTPLLELCLSNTKIIHFAGAGKPWNADYWGNLLQGMWENVHAWNRLARDGLAGTPLPMVQAAWKTFGRKLPSTGAGL